MSEETVTFNLELNVERAFSNARKLELIAFRALGLLNRILRMLGLPEDSPFAKALRQVQLLTMVIRSLHTSAVLLEAASGPIGWALAGLSVGSTFMATADALTSLGE